MTDHILSPAALAVLRACEQARDAALDEDDMLGLAASLRAAALYCKRDRLMLLAIADELEGTND
jgi:hypothetical protein